jgi:hypothetical protein
VRLPGPQPSHRQGSRGVPLGRPVRGITNQRNLV